MSLHTATFLHRIRDLKASGFPAPPTIPDLPSRVAVEIGQDLLRSPIFSVANTSLISTKRETLPTILLPVGGTSHITYRGPRLTQAHLSVLLHLISAARGKSPEEVNTFAVGTLCKEMGWSDGHYSHQCLWQAMLDLATATLLTRYSTGDMLRTASGIICDLERESAGARRVSFRLSRAGMELFRGYPAYVSLKQRARVREGLESWLYGYVQAFQFYSPVLISGLHHLSGSNRKMPDFGRDVRNALQALEDAGLIATWLPAGRGEVRIIKNGQMRRILQEESEAYA